MTLAINIIDRWGLSNEAYRELLRTKEKCCDFTVKAA